ncbi:hypothetical protein DICA3_C17040 [Diutina catenulata]
MRAIIIDHPSPMAAYVLGYWLGHHLPHFQIVLIDNGTPASMPWVVSPTTMPKFSGAAPFVSSLPVIAIQSVQHESSADAAVAGKDLNCDLPVAVQLHQLVVRVGTSQHMHMYHPQVVIHHLRSLLSSKSLPNVSVLSTKQRAHLQAEIPGSSLIQFIPTSKLESVEANRTGGNVMVVCHNHPALPSTAYLASTEAAGFRLAEVTNDSVKFEVEANDLDLGQLIALANATSNILRLSVSSL